ncbi:hypothetical protein F5Y15DRAFT_424631 [Xylariaceae sp. FL0016]|nr:hypothetical protein F5Y15DRAFT_424631 [Xylariaceae sp. FL0016]
MRCQYFTKAIVLAFGVSQVAAQETAVNDARIRNAPGSSSADTVRAISRSLHQAKLHERDEPPQNSTSLEKSWDGAVLFSLSQQVASAGSKNAPVTAGVEVTCTTCYLKGQAIAKLHIDEGFNASQELSNFTSSFVDEIGNITDTVSDYIEDYLDDVVDDLQDGFDLDDFDLPPMNVSFDLDVPDIPECRLHVEFDDLELYMLLDTVLSTGVTYEINLYSSNTPVGLSVSSDMFVGVIFAVDLILSADAEVDISSGMHIKIDDGLALDIAMFGQNVSDITFNGGSFEFLPVQVVSAGGLLKAVLRVAIRAGVEVSTPTVLPGIPFVNTTASAGMEVGIYADLAEFATNITAAPDGDDEDCMLRVQQSYQLGLGAAAGATVAIGLETWGPAPETQIPVWYTTFADVCATSRIRTTTTTSAAISARADDDGLTTTTLSQEVTYTGLACNSTGLINCPASLQMTSKVTSTQTFVTAVPSGFEATFPDSIQSTVATTMTLGTNAKSMDATTGSPISYVPPPPTSSSSGSHASETSEAEPLGEVGGVDTRVIIGVCVGLGVPVVACLIAGLYFCLKRKRYSPVVDPDSPHLASPSSDLGYSPIAEAKRPLTTVITADPRPGRY